MNGDSGGGARTDEEQELIEKTLGPIAPPTDLERWTAGAAAAAWWKDRREQATGLGRSTSSLP